MPAPKGNVSKVPVKHRNNSVGASSSDDEAYVPTFVPLSKLAPAKLYHELCPIRLSEEQLIWNGYPSYNPQINAAMIPATQFTKEAYVPANETLRKCARCSTVFELNADGSMPVSRCEFHHRPQCDSKTGKRVLPCCYGRPGSSKGCMVEETHVFTAASVDTLWDFVPTPPANGLNDFRSKKVYAIDTELVYTLNGMEAARVSMVDMKGRVVLDTYVLPQHEIVDFNTAFSGIEKKHMDDAISFETCRRQLFQLINEATILIGHSLEADLRALRICHYNVIDTAILFSDNTSGPFPRKFALRNLASKFLDRGIQDSASGHCSAEDARACIDLLGKRHELLQSKLYSF